jgi:hypothetical protein
VKKRLQENRYARSSARIQETYTEDFPCLLRVGGNAKRKEQSAKPMTSFFMSFSRFLPFALCPMRFAVFHRITLFDRANTLGRIVRPICLGAYDESIPPRSFV